MFDATIEVPITIRNPDKPTGTHVFTAMARNNAGLRWAAVTIDDGDDARDALDRITIPQEVLDRIAPTALPRSSIIISDEPLSRETNYRTEWAAKALCFQGGSVVFARAILAGISDDGGAAHPHRPVGSSRLWFDLIRRSIGSWGRCRQSLTSAP
jgi:hypothetical protein